MKKLVFIRHSNPFFDSSASGNRYAGLLKALASRNFKITVIITGGYASELELAQIGKYAHAQIEFVYHNKLKLYNKWHFRFWFYLGSHIIEGIMFKKIDKTVSSIKPNFVWLTIDSIVLGYYEKSKSVNNTKFIIEINEYNNISVEMGHTTNFLQKRNAVKEERLLIASLKRIDYLLTMTKILSKHFSKMVGIHCELYHLPMTVDLSRFDLRSSISQEGYIAFIGSFSNAKEGIDLLLKSMKDVINEYPNIRLKLAGPYHHDIPGQRKILEEYNLTENVEYIGSIDRSVVPEFLLNSKLLILPRPESKQAQGGFPTKLGEYLASGRPVVATRVGEIPDYLLDNESCFFAEPSNQDSLTKAILRALKNEDKANKVGQMGRRVAEKIFSADVQGEKLSKYLVEQIQ